MDPPERFHPLQQETLEAGGSSRRLGERLHPASRCWGAVFLSVVVGVVVGAGAVLGWNDQPDDRPLEGRRSASAATTPVRLVLGGVSAGAPRGRYLSLDGVLLHDRGPGTATVRRIHRPGTSLSIRAPDLPVTLSVNHPYERVRLRVAPRDCVLATEWTPSARPLTLIWEDEHGQVRSGIGGEHDARIELSLIQHMGAACGDASEP